MKIDLAEFFSSLPIVFYSDDGFERDEAPAPGLEEQESAVFVVRRPLRSRLLLLVAVVDARRGADLAGSMAFVFAFVVVVVVVDLDLD